MTDKQLLEQALEALEDTVNGCICRNCIKQVEAITAIRARLEQPEHDHMEDNLAMVAAPVQEPVKRWPFVETPKQFSNRLFEAIREFGSILPAVRNVLIENPPLYTTPPAAQRQWVGLTPDDRRIVIDQWRWDEGKPDYLCRLIEAKLKEKNT